MTRPRPHWIVLGTLVVLSAASCGGKRAEGPSESEPTRAAIAIPEAVAKDASAPATCGASGLPDCPLQGWMKANVASRLRAGDTAGLESAFRRIVTFEPAGYGSWKTTAIQGQQAAREGDLEGVRRACKECHDQHRQAYRSSLRERPLPANDKR